MTKNKTIISYKHAGLERGSNITLAFICACGGKKKCKQQARLKQLSADQNRSMIGSHAPQEEPPLKWRTSEQVRSRLVLIAAFNPAQKHESRYGFFSGGWVLLGIPDSREILIGTRDHIGM